MKSFMDLKISTKLVVCFTSLAIIVALVACAGISGLSKAGANSVSVYNDELIPVRALGFASTSLESIETEVRDMLLEKSVAERQKYVALINDEDKKLKENLAEYLNTYLAKEEQENIAVFKPAYEQYRLERAKAIDLLLNGQDAAAWKIINGNAKQHLTVASETLRKLIEVNDYVAKRHTDESKAAVTAARTQVLVLLAVAVLTCLLLGIAAVHLLGRPIEDMRIAAEKLAAGEMDVSFEIDNKDEMGALSAALRMMRDKINALVTDTQMLVQAAAEGNLATRADASKHEGEYRKVVEGVNATLDAIIRPVEEVKSVLERMAVNDHTRKITGNYPGALGELAKATIEAQDRLKNTVEIACFVAEGNFQEKLKMFKNIGRRSERDVLTPAFTKMMEAIDALTKDANMLSQAAVEGNLSTRADATKHKGDFRRIVQGVNATLDAMVGPMNEVNAVLKLMAVNDHTKKVEGKYNGDFAEMAQATNTALERIASAARIASCVARGDYEKELEELKRIGKRSPNDSLVPAFITMMEAIKALVNDANELSKAAVDGHLTVRADAAHHNGEFRKVIEGVNATLDAVVGPLKEVQQALGRLSDGDFTVAIEKNYSGEFNGLKDALNTMVVQVRSALQKIGKETTTLASASEQLESVSQQMSASAEETAAQANVVSAASEQVSTNIQTVATGADEMGASIREIAKNTADATKIANNAVQLSRTTNDTVRKLGASSAEIGQVIKVITSIAQQTNLLALNATIEAARAGEAGKGFAVVANEVKELAKQTAQATEDISQKIQAIQQDAGGAVTAIGQITEVIGQISDIQNTVATAIEEQSATTNEISRNLAEAAKGGADITLNITSVAQVAKTTTEAAGQTQMSAKSLETTAAQLRELVSQFRYEDAKPVAMAAHAGR